MTGIDTAAGRFLKAGGRTRREAGPLQQLRDETEQGQLFADAGKFDWFAGNGFHAQGGASAGIAIEFRQNGAGDVQGLIEVRAGLWNLLLGATGHAEVIQGASFAAASPETDGDGGGPHGQTPEERAIMPSTPAARPIARTRSSVAARMAGRSRTVRGPSRRV